MKKITATLALGFAITLTAGLGSTVKAQSTKDIETVNIRNAESFSYVKNLLQQNFDYTNPNLTPGDAQSILKFEVDKNGKIIKVRAEGKNAELNKGIENALTGLLYRAPYKSSPYVYVVPVNLQLAYK